MREGREHKKPAPIVEVGIRQIFAAFLLIGYTSFGGGILAHLRRSVVSKHSWLDDKTFLQQLAISQMLPGLKATNLAILVGDRLHGTFGAIAAMAGLCLPGAVLMYIVGVLYQVERERPFVEAALEGVAPAAVGLVLATTVELGRKSLTRVDDIVFVLLTFICIDRLHISEPRVLIGIGVLAVLWYGSVGARKGRPGR